MKSVTMVSFVFTLSFCLNLVAGKNLPYKTYLIEVEDKEDNNADPVKDAPKNADADYDINAKVIDGSEIHIDCKDVDVNADIIAKTKINIADLCGGHRSYQQWGKK